MWGSRGPDEEKERFPCYDPSRVGQRVAVDLVLLPRPADARAVDRAPSLLHESSEQALLSESSSGGEGSGENVDGASSSVDS